MDSKFYTKAADYWSKIPPTLEGILGGFGFISDIDISGSTTFLNELFSLDNPPGRRLALDCGAGIGRVTKDLLINFFEKVDMVEQNPAFIKEAENTIEPKSKLGESFPVGLQDFRTDKQYDVIWSQWVLGHLTDKDFVSFFIRCKDALAKDGIIVVKENVTSSGSLEKDEVDSSVTRSLGHLLRLFKKARLKILKSHRQTDFPKGIYPVYIFALVAKQSDVNAVEYVSIESFTEQNEGNDISREDLPENQELDPLIDCIDQLEVINLENEDQPTTNTVNLVNMNTSDSSNEEKVHS